MLNAYDFDDQQYHYNSVYNLTYTLKSKWSWLQIHGLCCQLCALHIQRSQCDPLFSVVRCVLCSRCPWKCLTPESYYLPENFSISNISFYRYSKRMHHRPPILSISNTNLGFYLGPLRLQRNPVPEYHLHLQWNVLAALWQNLTNMCHKKFVRLPWIKRSLKNLLWNFIFEKFDYSVMIRY